jgi:coenzyme F420-reducing hydrogenase delta subunit
MPLSCYIKGSVGRDQSFRERRMTDWQPKITSFLCNWCSYGAADLAGVSRLQYPHNFRIIRVPCSARVSPKFILAALRHGSDGVWVSG